MGKKLMNALLLAKARPFYRLTDMSNNMSKKVCFVSAQ